jgi:hypothetical protein
MTASPISERLMMPSAASVVAVTCAAECVLAVKVTGLGRPLDALAIFGMERSMFASNFPVAGLRIDYNGLVRAMKRMVAHLSVEDQERFFWRNACAFYRLAC